MAIFNITESATVQTPTVRHAVEGGWTPSPRIKGGRLRGSGLAPRRDVTIGVNR